MPRENGALPEQLESVDAIPEDALSFWDDETLKGRFEDMYRRYVVDAKGGWMDNLAIRAMQDELVNRGISPVLVLKRRGIGVESATDGDVEREVEEFGRSDDEFRVDQAGALSD